MSSSSRENSVIYNHAAVGSLNTNGGPNPNIMAVHNFNSVVSKKGPSSSNINSCSSGSTSQPNSTGTNFNNLPRSSSASAAMSLSVANTNGNIADFPHYRQHHQHDSGGNSTSNGLSVPSRFSRDSNRLSMQFGGDGGAKWADAADRYVKHSDFLCTNGNSRKLYYLYYL